MTIKKSIVFNGECIRVHLDPRSSDINQPGSDNHVMVSILVGDGEDWFQRVEVSSYWIDDVITQLQKAKKYMDESCIPDVDEQGKQWGYTFREESK